MLRLTRHRKLIWGTVLTALTVAVVVALQFSAQLERLEAITYDERMRLTRAGSNAHPDIAVIEIDQASLTALNDDLGRFPWPRSVYGDVIEFVAQMGGARAVIFDILFTEQEGDDANALSANDQRLINATRDAGNVFHAMQFIKEPPADVPAGELNQPLPEAVVRRDAVAGAQGFPRKGNNNFLLPIDGLYQASAGLGFVGMESDLDGVTRRLNLFTTYRGGVYPAMSVSPLLGSLLPRGGEVVHEGDAVRIGPTRVPVDHDGSYLVNMVDDFQPYSIAGVLLSLNKLRRGEIESLTVYPDEFKDKIVFVGARAHGHKDTKTTPLSNRTPGVEIHAAVASNLLSGDFLDPVPQWLTVVLVALLAGLTMWAILSIDALILEAMLPIVIGTAYAGWTLWRFAELEVYPVVAPLSAVALSWLLGFAYRAGTEGRDKLRVRRMFSQYVSPAVLAEVMDRYEDQLQAEVGSNEELSILFSDIRSFTSISETLPAAQVVELLNVYLAAMSDEILEHDGTLDKFIGDAVMAFWGAPIRVSDHAERAVAAALGMRRRLSGVNAELRARGYPAVDCGIGIHTAEVVLGNIGSERKLDYTVIGDNVNLASRLEGLTKHYATPVLISELTYQALSPAYICALVDRVRVKGRRGAIAIYWPLALPDDDPDWRARAFEQARLLTEGFQFYAQQEWEAAEARYRALPEEVALRSMFLARCAEFKGQPMPRDWDGVYTLDSK